MPLALTLAFALAATACTSTPPDEATDDARAPLRALLRQRAALLLAGDVEGFLRSLSPSARLAEKPIARGAMAVPLAGLDFVVGDADTSVPGGLDNA
jgi:pectin methylesterase-like acyl-CoA thioesterase